MAPLEACGTHNMCMSADARFAAVVVVVAAAGKLLVLNQAERCVTFDATGGKSRASVRVCIFASR